MSIIIRIPVQTVRRQAGAPRLDVSILQAFLAREGLLGWEIDGLYGPVTERAVKAFQAREGLAQDGIVGPATWSRLVSNLATNGDEPSDNDLFTDQVNSVSNGKTLTAEDYAKAAEFLGVDVATIRAVCEIESSGGGVAIAEYLKEKDWRMFALAYNGPGYAANQYDTRLAEAYRKWSGAVSREETA